MQAILVVKEKTSVLLVMKVHTLERTVNMMNMEEVGMELMEAQVHKNNQGGESMEEEKELGMEVVVVVEEKKSRTEVVLVVSALEPGDAMAARK